MKFYTIKNIKTHPAMNNHSLLNILFLSLSMFLISACGGEEKTTVVEEVIRPVKYGKVIMSGDALNETFSGSAQSSKESKVSFKVGGTVTQINVKVGDVIRKGQFIAKIDQTDYSIQFQQSVANNKSADTQIQSAKTQMLNSKATYKRVEKLYENNSVSISEFEQAKSGLDLAKSSYNAAIAQASASEKQVQSAQNQVRYSSLTAPFSGVITSVMVEENELVGSGTPIATLSAMINPEILVGVPEVFISKVKKNQEVEIVFSSMQDQVFSGKINEVGFSSLGGSTYPVTIQINKATENIRPGMVADVKFNFSDEKNKAQKMITPMASVGEDNTGHFVFSLIKNDNVYLVKKKKIEIGVLTTAGFEVKSGLANGDMVATVGLNTLLDGMKVRLLE
ncbi:MAG: multidrug efflux system membrane fusion protein [Saprospiraceae bacterium]|jgi:multidrug efflux system membrane fusion protein